MVRGQLDVSLLVTGRADQGVNVSGLDVVHLLDRLLDLPLVGLEVNDEHERVGGLDGTHGRFRVERVLEDRVSVHARHVRDRLASVLGSTRQTQGGRALKGDRSANLAERGRVGALQGGLFGLLGLGIRGYKTKEKASQHKSFDGIGRARGIRRARKKAGRLSDAQ